MPRPLDAAAATFSPSCASVCPVPLASLLRDPAFHTLPHKTIPHRIEINGLVDRPISLTMDELLTLPSITIPVTLVSEGPWGLTWRLSVRASRAALAGRIL